MRRAVVLVTAIAAIAGATGAHAHGGGPATHVGWPQTLPCATWFCNSYEYSTPCESPFPPGSYADVTTGPAPAPPDGKITVLRVTLTNAIDHDLYLCASNAARTTLDSGSPHLGESCTIVVTSLYMVGCHEDAAIPVLAGQRVILRAFNWLDAFPAAGRYWYEFV